MRYAKSNTEIDYGKIMALHRAGWNNAQIADEMRMTEEELADAASRCLNILDARIKKLETCYRQIAGVLTGG